MKVEDFVLVSDPNRGIIPFNKDDQKLALKYKSVMATEFKDTWFEFGFYKIAVETRWFGLRHRVSCERLKMEL